MNSKERRNAIVEVLQKNPDHPTPGKELSKMFNVSRQTIVQDMALIKTFNPNIASTSEGYLMIKDKSPLHQKEFKMHHAANRTEEELFIIVDHGGRVKNVSISHRVYGRITVELDIRSRQDAIDFMESFKGSKSKYLGEVTSGYHYHLVEADNDQRLQLIEQKLKEADLLAPLSPWEKEESEMI